LSEDRASYVGVTIPDEDVRSAEITEAVLERFVEGRERRFGSEATDERRRLWAESEREWNADLERQRRVRILDAADAAGRQRRDADLLAALVHGHRMKAAEQAEQEQ
jgi:hypothetical protein